MAVDRLLRYLVTHGTVFERVDDSSGRVADTYALAIEALGPLVGRLGAAASDLPERVTEALGASAYDSLTPVARAIIPTCRLRFWRPGTLIWRIAARRSARPGATAGSARRRRNGPTSGRRSRSRPHDGQQQHLRKPHRRAGSTPLA
ncbi:DUF6880 family protein [Cereibacter azotoformans]|uniref:DUF6880 family protein n=1 Tax=Cereibacter azotoformans TaxID=43057 RepID=UPI003B8A7FD2